MTRRQNLGGALASFAVVIGAAAGAIALPAGARGVDGIEQTGGGMNMGDRGPEASHAEMHELCHRMTDGHGGRDGP